MKSIENSLATKGKLCCQVCKSYTDFEYKVSKSRKNFMKPYYACLRCGGYLCWVEQVEKQVGEDSGDTTNLAPGQGVSRGSHMTSSYEEGSEAGNANNNLKLDMVHLKDEVAGLRKDQSELKVLLNRNEERLKMGLLMLLSNLFVCILVLALIKLN
ncbi:hypothetical protein DM860_010992 [Cuscuta australis]|uniref:Uncharacterized protein n=1 Tax=Cuscuta australis TaxID=267555 RepID=A0A328E1V9_9ASTE|nr:hypothetical protein DM860_010992 [Cuscuta australis]